MKEKSVRTKNQIIEVARRVFARKGTRNVTMNDLADAAGRGRRTLYLYFNNKEEIIDAVIDRELNALYKGLALARGVELPADDKLLHFMYTHLESMKRLVIRNGSLKADFFRDIWLVERVRSEFDRKEARLIEGILREGIEAGLFVIPHVEIMAQLLVTACKGLEVPYISGWMRHQDGRDFELFRDSVVQMIFQGIRHGAKVTKPYVFDESKIYNN